MGERKEYTYELRHGIHLAVFDNSERLTIGLVAAFLAEAMKHFKHHRDELKTDLYTEEPPYLRTIRVGRRFLGTMQLYYPVPNAPFQTAAVWTDAVINAYTTANTLEQIIEDLPEYREAAEQEGGGWVLEVVRLLESPGGEWPAFELMLKHTS